MLIPVVAYKLVQDKEKDYYCTIDIDEYVSNNRVIINKRHKIKNIYNYIDVKLSEAEVIISDNLLSEADFNVSDDTEETYVGFLKIAFVCCTDAGCFKNLYLLRKNKLGMLVHERKQAKFMIKKVENGYDVML